MKRKNIVKNRKKIDKIFSYVNQVKEGIIEKDALIIEKVSDFLNLRNTLQKKIWLKVAGYSADTNISFNEGILLMDYGFHVNSHCNGCGICKKVCPVQNITIVNERPQR